MPAHGADRGSVEIVAGAGGKQPHGLHVRPGQGQRDSGRGGPGVVVGSAVDDAVLDLPEVRSVKPGDRRCARDQCGAWARRTPAPAAIVPGTVRTKAPGWCGAGRVPAPRRALRRRRRCRMTPRHRPGRAAAARGRASGPLPGPGRPRSGPMPGESRHAGPGPPSSARPGARAAARGRSSPTSAGAGCRTRRPTAACPWGRAPRVSHVTVGRRVRSGTPTGGHGSSNPSTSAAVSAVGCDQCAATA